MLEGRSFLISRALPSSCEQESKLVYMTYRLLEVSNGKRPLEDEGEDELLRERKSSKVLDLHRGEGTSRTPQYLSLFPTHQSDRLSQDQDQGDTNNNLQLQVEVEELLGGRNPSMGLDAHERGEITLHLSLASQYIKQCSYADRVDANSKRGFKFEEIEEPHVERKSSKRLELHDLSMSPTDQSDQEGHSGGDQVDTSSLIQPLGRDISINCVLRCSRSDYNSIASLNRSFCNLIRLGEIYRLRRKMGIIEHWVYFSCHILEWEAFDPIRRRWMHLPGMPSNECFMCSDKESLAVGTELLVFGKEITSHVIWRYSILTNSWTSGMKMNAPRCLFGSASLGEIAILAGGCDSQGTVLSSAELYNSETGAWEILPSMNKPRKMCSGVFMDGKFYVIGGSNSELLSCGEEFNLETRTWREIPNMFPRRNEPTEAPPLVAVVNNELYAADYAEKEVRKYDKERVLWNTVGRLPERATSMNGWGLAFRACGEQLIVIGGPRTLGGGIIELNSWVPREGPPQWNLLASKHSGSFVYNCAVMGC